MSITLNDMIEIDRILLAVRQRNSFEEKELPIVIATHENIHGFVEYMKEKIQEELVPKEPKEATSEETPKEITPEEVSEHVRENVEKSENKPTITLNDIIRAAQIILLCRERRKYANEELEHVRDVYNKMFDFIEELEKGINRSLPKTEPTKKLVQGREKLPVIQEKPPMPTVEDVEEEEEDSDE